MSTEQLPYLRCPLHTVLKLTPVAYGKDASCTPTRLLDSGRLQGPTTSRRPRGHPPGGRTSRRPTTFPSALLRVFVSISVATGSLPDDPFLTITCSNEGLFHCLFQNTHKTPLPQDLGCRVV